MIIGLLVISVIHIVMSEWYLKRILKVKVVRKSTLSKERKKAFVISEFFLIIFFIASTFYVVENLGAYSPLPMFLFFLLLNSLRGIEEWKRNKSGKAYYHDLVSSVTFLAIFLFFLIGEKL